jgi:tRNA threonylcarbamoyl adenosine modification protein (Sua5/YciO/YrdC/YwlC family)
MALLLSIHPLSPQPRLIRQAIAAIREGSVVAFTPGPYTFLLEATREVPKRLQNPKRRTIGLRVPDNPIVRMLLAELGEPIMSSTLMLPGDEMPITDPQEVKERLGHAVDLVIDGGQGGFEPSSIVDLSGVAPVVVRHGKGDVSTFE